MWLDRPISHLMLMRRCVARGESPPLLGRVVDVAGCCAACQIVFAPAGASLPCWQFRTGRGLLPHWLFRTGGGLLPHWLFRRSVAAVAWVV
jgi:hypothetical protein